MKLPKYKPKPEDLARLENNISHHTPHGDQAVRYEANREDIKILGNELLHRCPPSRELSLALTHLEEVCFWANAAIARNENKAE